jgi:hypothetical protein
MDGEYGAASSHRLQSLAEKFRDKRYREGYVAAHTRGVLADQMRNFRGDLSQADYAAKIGKQKTVVGRLENPAYSGWSLRTMLEIARKEDVAVLVRFVDFPTFLGFTDDMSDESLRPRAYDQAEIDFFAEYQSGQISYHNLRPLNFSGGMMVGRPYTYPDIFFGSPIGASQSNFTAVNLATGTAAISSNGPVLTVPGMTYVGPNLFDQTLSGFVTSGFPTPPTSGALARAHAEIRRLKGIVEAKNQRIQELEANPQQISSQMIQGQGQGIARLIQGAYAAQAANQNEPTWQFIAWI